MRSRWFLVDNEQYNSHLPNCNSKWHRFPCHYKYLVCRFNWRYIFTYIVINVHSSVVSAINHLLITVKWIQWFINIWILHISEICVPKISDCHWYIINDVKLNVVLLVLSYGRYLLLVTTMSQFLVVKYKTSELLCCNFSCLKPISRSTVLLRISLIVTNSRPSTAIHWA